MFVTVQTVLSFLCSRALGRAIDLVEDLLQRYQEVSTSWEKGTPLAQYAGLLNQTRPVFTSMVMPPSLDASPELMSALQVRRHQVFEGL